MIRTPPGHIGHIIASAPGPDQGDADVKSGVPEQAGVQGPGWVQGQRPSGGEAPRTLQNSSICKTYLWPFLASYQFSVLLFV